MKISKNMTSNFSVQWLIVFALSLLVRLPYFLGNHFYFDGDEAIIGIMAQDLLNGNNIPVYFYGQQYGFSFFEVVATSFCMLFFGTSIWSLKLGALFIFSIGGTFLFRLALKKTNHFWWSMLIIFIVAQFPSWIVWACKDRGGYVTAFALSCILLYITQLKLCSLKSLILALLLTSILIHSQIFIGIPSIILVIYWVLKSKKRNLMVLMPLVLAGFYFLLKLPAFFNPNYWQTPLADNYSFDRLVLNFKQIPRVAFGYFYYEITFPMNFWTKIAGAIYFLVSSCAIFYVFVQSKSKTKIIFILLALGGVVSFLLLGEMRFVSYRYSLGFLTAFVLMLIIAMIELIGNHKGFRKILFLIIPATIVLSVFSKNIPDSWMLPQGNDRVLYTGLVAELKTRNIEGIYSTDPLLQWMLNYNGLNARHTSKMERTNRYLNRINACFNNNGCITAIVGYKGMCLEMDYLDGWHNQVEYVNDKFFILMNPSEAFLMKGGFELQK